MQSSKDMLYLAIEIAQLVAEAEQSGDGQVIEEGKELLLAILEGKKFLPRELTLLKSNWEDGPKQKAKTKKSKSKLKPQHKGFAGADPVSH
jgi:hypothetical protein